MGRIASRFLGTALLALAALAAGIGPVHAAAAATDTQGVRAVILAQFQAFADDDADAAFDTATPAVRQQVGHASYFLAQVRGGYPMLYRPTAIRFLEVEMKGRRATQLLRIVDTAGRPWLVVFTLERQADRQWRIAGCTVGAAPAEPA